MSAKFELFSDKSGQFRFRFKAANGQITLASESYSAKAGAENGVESVRANAGNDERYARETAKDGRHYFNLMAANHQVIGTSETYNTTEAMENGIAELKADAPDAPLMDLTG